MTRPTLELPSALASLERIRALAEGKRLAVFLDYDGTLTPIVERPELAVLSREMRDTVQRLADRAAVAVVSGRDLRDVKAMVELEDIYYAGSHGFEIVTPSGKRLDGDPGAVFLPALSEAEAALERATAGVPGLWVERKKFSIAVHYRQVAPEDVASVEPLFADVASRYDRLQRVAGKKIYELQPRVDWHKGKAVLRLMEELGLRGGKGLAIYIGDDVTDESAFEALAGVGIGVVVTGEQRPTAAEYRLPDTGVVRLFLEKLT